MGFKGIFTTLGLVTDDAPSSAAVQKPADPAPVLRSPFVPQVAPLGNVDPEMVAKLKASVLGASPIIKQFMQNLEIAKLQFPNDETGCMKAALAFTRVEKSILVEELNRTVTASLQHTKKSMDTDRQKARETAVGSLDADLSDSSASIKTMEAQIAELQQSIASKKTAQVQIQQQIQSIETDLRRQDDAVNASFTQVEQYITLLGQTFTKL